MTQIGQYDKRVVFLERVEGRDPEGQPLVGAGAWSEAGGAWANIRFQTGLEAIRSDAVTNLVPASIRIQGRPKVTEKTRVQYGAMIFEITSVVPDDRQEHFDLVCQLVR